MGIEPTTAPRLGPLDLLAAGLDRYRSDGRALWAYYASSIPFAVLLVAALAQTLHTRVEHLRWLSAALAAGYLLRLWGASRYSRRLFGTGARGWESFGKQVWNHAIIVAAWFLLLPFLAGCGLFYAAAQHAALDPEASLRSSIRLAASWWTQQWPLLALMLLFGAILFVNAAIVAMLLPTLWHMLIGTGGTAASAGGALALLVEPTYWLGLLACVHLALDPWARAAIVVAHERLKARRSGADLIVRVRNLPQRDRARQVASMLVLALALGLMALPKTLAAQTPPSPTVNAARMGQAIRAELLRPAYRWHSSEAPPIARSLDRALGWFFRPLGAMFRWIGKELDRFLKRIENWLKGVKPTAATNSARNHSLKSTAWALIAVTVLLLGLVLIEVRRRRRAPATAAEATPSLEVEAHEAASASDDEWLALALRLQAQGDWQQAFRAAFLAGLAYLGKHQWIHLRTDRTNREYRIELAHRVRLLPEGDTRRDTLAGNFGASVRAFDAVWYGGQAVDAPRLNAFLESQRSWVGL